MKKHRQWHTLVGYFKKVPIDDNIINKIKILLKEEKNILIMIKKEDHESNPEFTEKQKVEAIWEAFPIDSKMGKIIVSIVPDIIEFEKVDL